MATTKERYIESVGRRKTAVARIRITPAGRSAFVVNEQPLEEYFPTNMLQKTATDALHDSEEKFKVSAKVLGGGIAAQAEAVRHGIARALITHNEELRKGLKKKGFLTRDPRMKERRKFGLKKARKAAAWSKR